MSKKREESDFNRVEMSEKAEYGIQDKESKLNN